MSFIGKGIETYIYLNGIKPSEPIPLGNGLELRPAKCNPDPDAIIAKSRSEIDIGVACVFLRSVSACFRVTAQSPKELAVRAWNSQWDAVLLSALHGCEIGCTFQSDVPPEQFSSANDFHVTNYHFKGLDLRGPTNVTPVKRRWMMNHYHAAKALLDRDQFREAVHCLSSYRWHTMPRLQLALLWSGIEGLFGVDYELSFRLSLYTARFLSPRSRVRQKAIFDSTKKLYSVRSKAVHGGKLKNPEQAVDESIELLRKLIVKCAETKSLPDTSSLAL